MRYIEKHPEEPEAFSRWKKQNKKADWRDFSTSAEHRELREQLLAEQVGMCCYCEVMLTVDDSHIEHLKPKSRYPQERFAYGNLLASCNRKKSCGHKKGTWYRPEMVSPLTEGCEERFTYTLDGRMIPSDKEDKLASETIEQLGLNCATLKDRRKSIIKALDNGGNGPEPDYLQTVVAGILNRKSNWPFGFPTVVLFIAAMYDIAIP
ncbi:retron system putative HNH endonuclease [Candidatus Electrothrix sp.]|uniref:retron system putative HNH endonuclease n=1 Tax=Candidatus Electrothrix sp. TaxID=2170559 RepID=UPI004056A8EB